LSVGIVLLDLVPAGQHQPELFAPDNHRRQKLSPLIDRINNRYHPLTAREAVVTALPVWHHGGAAP
jgi:hypothetical protein